MLRIILITGMIFSGNVAFSMELYVGTITRAVGMKHMLVNQPCKVTIYQADAAGTIFNITVGEAQAFFRTVTATPDNRVGIENLNYDFANQSNETRIEGTPIVQQERILTKKTDDGIKIKILQREWIAQSFYSSTPYQFVCEANRTIGSGN